MSTSSFHSPPETGSPAHSPLRSAAGVVLRMVSGLHQRRLLAVAILLVISVYDFARPTDIDLWWHLKTGEIIATTHSIPVSDPFSNPAHGYPWTVHEWLWDLVIYSLFRRGGYRLLVLVSGAVVSLTYGIVYHLLRRLGTNEFVAAALVIWAAWLGLPNFGVRPRELTLLFLALYLNRLFLYQSGQVRRLWLLPLLMLVWVNIHGGFILGLGVAGIFVLGALWEKLICRGSLDSHLLMVSLAVLAACCLNPTGPRILAYSVGYYLQGNNPSFATVSEFQSPDFHDPLYLAFAASLLALMLLGRHSETREAKDNPERTRTYRTGLRTVTEGLLLHSLCIAGPYLGPAGCRLCTGRRAAAGDSADVTVPAGLCAGAGASRSQAGSAQLVPAVRPDRTRLWAGPPA